METQTIEGITLFYDAAERETAGLIAGAAAISARRIEENWGLGPPERCRVFIMTSWLDFIFRSGTWPQRIAYGLTLPFWYYRIRKLWPSIGGWTQLQKNNPAIGIKPHRLMETADRTIGRKIYIQEDDMARKVQFTLCHELTHAFSSHLKLPFWLNEGLAMITVDRFAGRPTIRPDSIELVRVFPRKTRPVDYRFLPRMNPDGLAYQYARGYWITRLLEEQHPGFVRSLLLQPRIAKAPDKQVAEELALDARRFWSIIDDALVRNFSENPGTGPRDAG